MEGTDSSLWSEMQGRLNMPSRRAEISYGFGPGKVPLNVAPTQPAISYA